MLADNKLWTERNCPICGDSHKDVLVNLPPKVFCETNFAYQKDAISILGLKEDISFPIVRCKNCSFVYSRFLLTPKLLCSVYEEVIDSDKCFEYSTSLPVVKQNLRIWYTLLSMLPQKLCGTGNVRVLDYGAGWGTFLKVARSPRVEVFGYETSARRLAYLRKSNIKVLTTSQEAENKGPYHVICCNQVLEHVPCPVDTLNLINKLMCDEAVAYFSVPNYKDEILQKQLLAFRDGKHVPKELNPWEHLNYFTPHSFRQAISMCNFDIPSSQNFTSPFETSKSSSSMLQHTIRNELRMLKLLFKKFSFREREGTEVIARKKKT